MRSFWQALAAGNLLAALKFAGRGLGLDVRRNGPSSRDDLRLANFIKFYGVDVLFDIGANRGQFAEQLFANGYDGRVVSFEAMPHAHNELTLAATRRGDRWQVAPAIALSDRGGVVPFHINDSDATSSLLVASDEALKTIVGLGAKATVEVPTARLDDVFDEYAGKGRRSFLKIDVQGGEGRVLAGAQKALSKISGLVIELSLSEIYESQPMAFDVLAPLLAEGFAVYDITPAYRDPVRHKLEQIDVLLFHPDRIA